MNGVQVPLIAGRLLTTYNLVHHIQGHGRTDNSLPTEKVRQALGNLAGPNANLNRQYLAGLVQIAWYERFIGVVPDRCKDSMARIKEEMEAAAALPPPEMPAAFKARQFKKGERPAGRPDRPGPTALAKRMLEANPKATDDAILDMTMKEFGPESKHPLKFTRGDLKRVRERMKANK